MTGTVTLIVPTYTRLSGLKRLIVSIQKHTNYPYEILVVVDDGNIATYHWAADKGLFTVLTNNHRWYVAQTNLGVFLSQTELFVYLNDDMEIVETGWLGRAVNLFAQKFPKGSGLLRLNDKCQPPGGIATCGLSSKRFVRAIYGSTFLCFEYTHYASDKELTIVARRAKIYYESDVPIRHHRPQKDPVYDMSAKVNWDKDQATFERRKAAGFPR